ncbi:MAG: ABC transporter permease [Dehalococcoidales bacterium]|nr:ABC transporter permease [Dehalococcoidales bacterium]
MALRTAPVNAIPAVRRTAAALRCSPSLRLGLVLLGGVVLLSLLVPLLTPYAPDEIIAGGRLLPPGPAHPFGTDALGRDLLSRVAHGGHLAARMALGSVGLSLTVGLILGSLAGYYGGWADQLLSRFMDGWLALPGVLVALIIVARLGSSLENLIVALGLMGIPAFYRLVRSSTLSVRRAPFVEAATAVGASDRRIMWRHVFPNILSPVVVLVTIQAGTALLTGSSLSFIGLGAQPPLPEWGAMLAAGRNYLDTAWWLAAFPGLAVTAAVVGLNLLGDGLRDVLDPQSGVAAGRGEEAPGETEEERWPYRQGAGRAMALQAEEARAATRARWRAQARLGGDGD